MRLLKPKKSPPIKVSLVGIINSLNIYCAIQMLLILNLDSKRLNFVLKYFKIIAATILVFKLWAATVTDWVIRATSNV